MSPKIIVGAVFPTIIKRLKLIGLFRDRHIVHGQSLDLPPLHRDRRLATARHEYKYREVIRRSSSTLGERAHCTRGQCPHFTFALTRVHRTALFAQRNYRNTLSKQESIRRAPRPRPRSRTGRNGMPIANRARSLARSLDCDRIATRSDHKENKENVAWRGYESSSTSDYAFLAMSNDPTFMRPIRGRDYIARDVTYRD